MRVNLSPGISPGNQYLGAQPEFAAFQPLYARYEVVGMKAETTLNARNTFAAANMAGGFAPNLLNPALFPSEEANASYPLQVDCNTQGEVTSLYYQYSKDLKNSGATFAKATTKAYEDSDQGMIQFRGILGTAPTAGTVVGSIKFTWYVRFHGRTKPAGLVLRQPKANKENEDPQSEMSYADLQHQVQQLMQR